MALELSSPDRAAPVQGRSLEETVVALADLVREVYTYGRTARFDQRAPSLLQEARLALEKRS